MIELTIQPLRLLIRQIISTTAILNRIFPFFSKLKFLIDYCCHVLKQYKKREKARTLTQLAIKNLKQNAKGLSSCANYSESFESQCCGSLKSLPHIGNGKSGKFLVGATEVIKW